MGVDQGPERFSHTRYIYMEVTYIQTLVFFNLEGDTFKGNNTDLRPPMFFVFTVCLN